MANILVTGAGGFVGRGLVSYLASFSTNKVLAVDKIWTKNLDEKFGIINLENSGFVEFAEVDLCDSAQVKTLGSFDIVYHLAALNGTSRFYSSSWEVFLNSLLPTINLVNHFKSDTALKRFVYTSSSEVYASLVDLDFVQVPTGEDSPVGFSDLMNPRWSYASAKLSGEFAIYSAHNQHNMPFSVIRYHNVYGPNMGTDHVIPDFISRCRTGEFSLFGSGNIRSFIYIDDAIRATKLIAENGNAANRVIHVGTEEPVSMLELANLIMKLGGWEGSIKVNPAPRGSTLRRIPHTHFLREILGFRPEYSLDEGLRKILELETRR